MSKSVVELPWIPTPTDGQSGETLRLQAETEHKITDVLAAHSTSFASPVLQKQTHLSWLAGLFRQALPQGYTSLDASRPWIIYWVLHSFALLGGELDPAGKARAVETLLACQHPEGGFGGGPGQLAHLAPTYAAVCALAYAGEEGWDKVDRKKMYAFLHSLKQPDGSFIMHHGGEVDVRGTYCALSVATILNLLTPSLASSTPSFIASCQTYEGGLASSAQPYSDGSAAPLGEAHGGYAFCAIASWAMLRVYSDPSSPAHRQEKSEKVDLKALRRWATAMQANPIDGGGFRGRTNKLVDGCYSWWNGALFGVLQALVDEGKDLTKAPEDLFSREGLQEYVLLCAQAPNGGLRDKPGKGPDAYHTCYNLAGLSSAQHGLYRPQHLVNEKRASYSASLEGAPELILDEGETKEEARVRMSEVWASAVSWTEGRKSIVGGEDNELQVTNPVVNVVQGNLERIMARFYGQPAPEVV